MSRRVVVGMSGGVDSSVAAALLVEQGYDVIGVTLNVWPKGAMPDRVDACCSLSSVEDARRVADQLGIPHYVLNFRDVFQQKVITNFVAEYRRGRTPNPCVRCNEHIKFEAVLHRMHGLDADYVATGHYVRLERLADRHRHALRRAVDETKDQSYVLYPLTQELLARSLFPLGGYTKPAIRRLAAERGFVVASKPESMEICFVQNNRYGDYLRQAAPEVEQVGPIVNRAGQTVGEHRGIAFYTVGQRKGLGVTTARPTYVLELDPARNAVVVGAADELYARTLIADQVNFVALPGLDRPMRVRAKARSRMPLEDALVSPEPDGTIRVTFDRPQRALTPGQAIVCYDGDLVVCGGTIDRVLSPEP